MSSDLANPMNDRLNSSLPPTSDTTSAVTGWLTSNGVTATPISPAGDWLSISIPVSKANELFDADFSVFTHQASGQESIRTLSYSIPSELKGQLDLVHPTITYVWSSSCLGPRR